MPQFQQNEQIQPTQEIQQLGQGQLLCLRVPNDTQLRIVKGQTWVTIEGSIEDYVLNAGEILDLTPGRSVLIEGISACTVAIQVTQESAAVSEMVSATFSALMQGLRRRLQRWNVVSA